MTATTEKPTLPEFEGHDVAMAAVRIKELQRVKDEIEGQMRLDALQAEKDAEERERRDSNMGGPA
jgi:hypothetical protein